MTLTLHPHQRRAVAAAISALRAGHTPVLSVATGGGKSLIAADLAYRGHGRVLVTAHRKELVAGNAAEMLELHPDADVGVYSAGVGRRDTANKVIFAGIDSVVSRMANLQASGLFSAVIVDEAHRIPLKNKPSRYRTLLEACPGAKLIGMTATPYRLDGGLLYDGPDTWFDDLAIDVGIRELTDLGLLTPLTGVRGDVEPDLKGVARSGGDWSPGELSERMMEDEVVQDAMAEIMALAKDRESWLIFCVDVKHVELVTKELQIRSIDARSVTGKTPKDERDTLINGFKNREFRALVNCEILTTGSNLPCADCGILLRPTESKGLLVQMLGRLTRLYPGKSDSLILDLCGVIERHRPLDGLGDPPLSTRAQSRRKRRDLARAQRERYAKHGTRAWRGDLWDDDEPEGEVYPVHHVQYRLVAAKNKPGRTNIVAEHHCTGAEGTRWVRVWICPEYGGRAGAEASKWFKRRGLDMPRDAKLALDRLGIMKPSHIRAVKEDGFWRVLEEVF